MVASTSTKTTKTAFLNSFLHKNPKANTKSVNAAWMDAGNTDTISGTLVSKLRSELGLVGNLRKLSKKKTETNGSTVHRKVGRPRKNPVETLVLVNGSTPEKTTKITGRVHDLDAVEAGIDDLIFSLKSLGGFADIEASLRAARRQIARSH